MVFYTDLNFLLNYNRMGSWSAAPIPLGDKYKKVGFSANITGVTENGTVTITQSFGLRNLAYTAGQSVLITKASDSSIKFEGIVQSYDSGTATIVIEQLTNISGPFGIQNYTINLVGERGSKITSGNGLPNNTNGRIGDMYIDKDTGDMYIKQ